MPCGWKSDWQILTLSVTALDVPFCGDCLLSNLLDPHAHMFILHGWFATNCVVQNSSDARFMPVTVMIIVTSASDNSSAGKSI